MYSSFKK